MKEDLNSALVSMQDMLKLLVDNQQQLLKEIRELKQEQRKLEEVIRLNNFVLNNLTVRREIMN